VKKAMSIVLFMLSLLVLTGISVYYYSTRESRQAALLTNCESKPSSEFSKQLSYGVVLRDNTVAALKLDGERNFSLPGGNIEVNETPEQTLAREFREELGLQVESGNLRSYQTYCETIGITTAKRVYVYFVDDWNGTISVGEKDQLKWVESDFASRADADSELSRLLNNLVNEGKIPKIQPTIESQFE
jgi:8-oxo-dGTP pyrophosphatase MutT (NUDIX family)